MAYYRFTTNDLFVNTLKLYPEIKFVINSGSVYYNNTPNFAGSLTSSLRLVSSSNISLYELNIDRAAIAGADWPGTAPDGASLQNRLVGRNPEVPDTGLIYPWIVKDGSRMNFRTSTTASFGSYNLGDVIRGAYPLSATLEKEFFAEGAPRFALADIEDGTGPGGIPHIVSSGSVSNLLALQNTINYYQYLSPHYQYSSSAAMIDSGIHDRDFGGSGSVESCSLGLISMPSIFYGREIKKGSITLEYYFTGSLIARAQDTRQNGELIQTYASGTSTTGSVIGIALYSEGFLILTGATALNSETDDYYVTDNPKWIYFGRTGSTGTDTPASSSFILSMSGTTDTQVMTMFAHAPKGELNHSNNPSYLKYTYMSGASVQTGSTGYIQSQKIKIKNVVSSAYNDPTGSFEKTTYISTIGIYDKTKRLVAIAKTATPIKKTVNRDFTFKLKLDI